MITSMEVGAVFRIIDEASPGLSKILKQVRELNKMIDTVKKNMAELSRGLNLAPAGMSTAIGEAKKLADAWGDVAASAGAARMAIGNASRAAGAGAGAGGAGGANVAAAARGRRMARGGAGHGVHIGGPSVAIPGGSHVSFRGGAAAALGLTGYGAYEAAQMEDSVFQLIYHSGLEQNAANRSKFRKILQDSMAESGYSLHDVSESAKQEIRMFQGTPGGGVDVLPEMLRAATIESRLKGESPESSMKALIGLAHMTKQYDQDAIKKLAPAFAFLSTADPRSLSSIERAAGYAVPILQSSLEIDPMDTLLEGTALARAGITNSKSGTWLREAATRAMPGTSMMSKMAFKKHEAGLRRLGLIDESGKPTWFGPDGKPDLLKLQEIVGENAPKIPLGERAGVERQVFGAQGSGALAVLGDPNVNAQVHALKAKRDSKEFKNQYAGFTEAYKQGSTVQNARTAVAEFNNTMMDIGKVTLPAVNIALGNFKGVLEGIRNLLPNTDGKGFAHMGGAAITGASAGALAGGVVGLAGGPVGMVGGAVAGGVLGTAYGFLEQYNDGLKLGFDKAGTYTSPGKTGKPAQPITVNPPQVGVTINLDGQTIGQAIMNKITELGRYQTDTAAANGGIMYGP